MTRLVLRRRAKADIAEIWVYTADRWSIDQADAYNMSLEAAFDRLIVTPSLGIPCPEISEGYHRYRCGSHVIFYTLENDILRIGRVLHQSRDFRRHL